MRAASGIDMCWRRIGSAGDGSCPRLPEMVSCRNCDTFASAGRSLLDRELPETPAREAPPAMATEAGREGTVSVVVFRLGEEWFALPTTTLQKVVALRRSHPVPHRHNVVLQGLVNIDGSLVLCASLAAVLGVRHQTPPDPAQKGARVLLLEGHGQRWACPVDEVAGVHRTSPGASDALPVTLAKAAASHCAGILLVHDTSVALLDPEAVFSSLAASVGGWAQ